MGKTLGDMGCWDEAEACLDRALKVNPNDASAWHNRGVALNGAKRFEEAVACYDRAIALASSLVEAWCCKGASLSAL